MMDSLSVLSRIHLNDLEFKVTYVSHFVLQYFPSLFNQNITATKLYHSSSAKSTLAMQHSKKSSTAYTSTLITIDSLTVNTGVTVLYPCICISITEMYSKIMLIVEEINEE